jgi:archaemetzincin
MEPNAELRREHSSPNHPTGPTVGQMTRAFAAAGHFAPLHPPGPADWLATHAESPQDFEAFLRANARRPDATRRKIYLQPLGAFPAGESPPIERLAQFTASFFGMDVEVMPIVAWEDGALRTRPSPRTGDVQIRAEDMMTILRQRRPQDAYCIIGLTMDDLYARPDEDFAFGAADFASGVAVYSLSRYQVRHGGEAVGQMERVILGRACKVLVHGTCHLFGIDHCAFFRCIMNGANHTDEADGRPMHLCPIDLRKLQHVVGFDVVERYRRLAEFHRAEQFLDEAAWCAMRAQFVAGA